LEYRWGHFFWASSAGIGSPTKHASSELTEDCFAFFLLEGRRETSSSSTGLTGDFLDFFRWEGRGTTSSCLEDFRTRFLGIVKVKEKISAYFLLGEERRRWIVKTVKKKVIIINERSGFELKRENELNIALLIFTTFHFPHLLNPLSVNGNC